jgi:hypothetical protein
VLFIDILSAVAEQPTKLIQVPVSGMEKFMSDMSIADAELRLTIPALKGWGLAS